MFIQKIGKEILYAYRACISKVLFELRPFPFPQSSPDTGEIILVLPSFPFPESSLETGEIIFAVVQLPVSGELSGNGRKYLCCLEHLHYFHGNCPRHAILFYFRALSYACSIGIQNLFTNLLNKHLLCPNSQDSRTLW